jgi:hypothetical protein
MQRSKYYPFLLLLLAPLLMAPHTIGHPGLTPGGVLGFALTMALAGFVARLIVRRRG